MDEVGSLLTARASAGGGASSTIFGPAPTTKEEVQSQFTKMDMDGDGKIQFTEFAHWLGVPAAAVTSTQPDVSPKLERRPSDGGGGGGGGGGAAAVAVATAAHGQMDILLETGSPPDTGPIAAGLWAAAFLTSWESQSLTSGHVKLLPRAGTYGLAHELPQGWYLADMREQAGERAAAVGLEQLDVAGLRACKWKVGGPQKYRGGQPYDPAEPVEVRLSIGDTVVC
eukprot:SAG22_NODE_1645_length_3901_cov_2.101262_2_plen_226_part_00